MKPIFVTQPYLPPLQEFIPYLEQIWASKQLTNRGPMHQRLEAELQHQALHDPLTGLGNRILLQRKLESAVAHDDRFGHVSVMLLDLDGFKHVNDTHGHGHCNEGAA